MFVCGKTSKWTVVMLTVLVSAPSIPAFAQDQGLGTYISQQNGADDQAAISSRELTVISSQVTVNVLDRAFPKMTARWDDPSIAVCWENFAQITPNDRKLVEEAVRASWSAASQLDFTGWQQCVSGNQGIRVRAKDSGPHTVGLGNELDAVPNGMVLNFEFRKWSTVCAQSEASRQSCIKSIAVHEFGHAIGLSHEQNRIDTPDDSCFQRRQGDDGDTLLTPWDPNSVMNYCNPVYNNNGVLSNLDAYAAAALYGVRG